MSPDSHTITILHLRISKLSTFELEYRTCTIEEHLLDHLHPSTVSPASFCILAYSLHFTHHTCVYKAYIKMRYSLTFVTLAWASSALAAPVAIADPTFGKSVGVSAGLGNSFYGNKGTVGGNVGGGIGGSGSSYGKGGAGVSIGGGEMSSPQLSRPHLTHTLGAGGSAGANLNGGGGARAGASIGGLGEHVSSRHSTILLIIVKEPTSRETAA